MVSFLAHLVEVVQRLATDLGFADASGIGTGWVWVDPNRYGTNYTWRHPWSEDIVEDLVSSENSTGGITNSELELAAPALQQTAFPLVSKAPEWCAPTLRSDNTPMVAWSSKEAPTANEIIADLLRICSLANRQIRLAPSVFYHPGEHNTSANVTTL